MLFSCGKKNNRIKLNLKFDFLNLLMFYGVICNIGISIEVILLLISFIRFDLV